MFFNFSKFSWTNGSLKDLKEEREGGRENYDQQNFCFIKILSWNVKYFPVLRFLRLIILDCLDEFPATVIFAYIFSWRTLKWKEAVVSKSPIKSYSENFCKLSKKTGPMEPVFHENSWPKKTPLENTFRWLLS